MTKTLGLGTKLRSVLIPDGTVPSSGPLSRRRWLLPLGAAIVEIVVLLLADRAASELKPLAPLGAVVLFFSVLSAALSGIPAGLAVGLLATIASFLTLADLSTSTGVANACLSAALWCGSPVVAGLFARYLWQRVDLRESALQQALARSLQTRRQLEQVMEFCPRFQQGAEVQEVLDAICQTAVETFGADGARLYSLREDSLQLLAASPETVDARPGLKLPADELPGFAETLSCRRPVFIRDLRSAPLGETARRVQTGLRAVSVVRVPIISTGELVGLLIIGWDHLIEQPPEDLLAIMQRFADQAAIAWQNALRMDAQRRADSLHTTLQKVLELAPTFHITGPSEQVAQAVCEAALATFGCTGSALYEVQSDRIILLDRQPPLAVLAPGATFPLGEEMPLARELLSRFPTFVPDVDTERRLLGPWPREVIRQADVLSALYLPLRFDERGPQNLLVLSWNYRREEPDPGFLAVVERFGDQVALALSNASAERLHTRLEASLLPPSPVEHPLVSVVMRYRPGETRLRLGGDFLDSALTAKGGVRFVIGDVTGHGPDAAALGATLRSTWKALALAGESLVGIAQVMDQMLVAERRERQTLATLLTGEVDPGKNVLHLLSAGHPSPILVADGAAPLELPAVPPLGFARSSPWLTHRVSLPPRWRLFCYTDGLVDIQVAPGSSQSVNPETLLELISRRIGRVPFAPPAETQGDSLNTALDLLLDEIRNASQGRFADDVAVLVLSSLACASLSRQ